MSENQTQEETKTSKGKAVLTTMKSYAVKAVKGVAVVGAAGAVGAGAFFAAQAFKNR